MPKRIQLSRAKGWRLPANAAKVDRTTHFGNPYVIGERMDMKMVRRWGWHISPEGQRIVCKDASDAVRRFEHALQWDEAIHDYVREELCGKDLACWCALDQPCHVTVLLRIANSKREEIRAANDAADAVIMAQAAAASR
jgi:hypothetical protein